jgi:hypothetical protein
MTRLHVIPVHLHMGSGGTQRACSPHRAMGNNRGGMHCCCTWSHHPRRNECLQYPMVVWAAKGPINSTYPHNRSVGAIPACPLVVHCATLPKGAAWRCEPGDPPEHIGCSASPLLYMYTPPSSSSTNRIKMSVW